MKANGSNSLQLKLTLIISSIHSELFYSELALIKSQVILTHVS